MDVNQLIKKQSIRRLFILLRKLHHKNLFLALQHIEQVAKLNCSKKEKILDQLAQKLEYKKYISEIKPFPILLNENIKKYLQQEREKENKLQLILTKLVNNQHFKIHKYFQKWKYEKQNSLDFMQKNIHREFKQQQLTKFDILQKIVNAKRINHISSAFQKIISIAQNNFRKSRGGQHIKSVASILFIFLNHKQKELKNFAFLNICKKYSQKKQLISKSHQDSSPSDQSEQINLFNSLNEMNRNEPKKRTDQQIQIDKAIIKEQALFGQKYQQKIDRMYSRLKQYKGFFRFFNIVYKWRQINLQSSFQKWKQILQKQGNSEKLEFQKILVKVSKEVEELKEQLKQIQPPNFQIGALELSQNSNLNAVQKLRQTVSAEKIEQEMMLSQQSGQFQNFFLPANNFYYQQQQQQQTPLIQEISAVPDEEPHFNPHEQEMENKENHILTLKKKLLILNMTRKLILIKMENKQNLEQNIQNFYLDKYQQEQTYYTYIITDIQEKMIKLNSSIELQNTYYFNRFIKEEFENIADINGNLYQIYGDEDYALDQIVKYLMQEMDDQTNFQSNQLFIM